MSDISRMNLVGGTGMHKYVIARYDPFEGIISMKKVEASSAEEALLTELEVDWEALGDNYSHDVEGISQYGYSCDMPIEIMEL